MTHIIFWKLLLCLKCQLRKHLHPMTSCQKGHNKKNVISRGIQIKREKQNSVFKCWHFFSQPFRNTNQYDFTSFDDVPIINYSRTWLRYHSKLTELSATLPCVGVHFTREVFFEKQVSSRHLYYYNNCNFYSRSQNTGHLSPTALNCRSFSNSISLFLSTLLLFIFDHFGVESVSSKKYIWCFKLTA